MAYETKSTAPVPTSTDCSELLANIAKNQANVNDNIIVLINIIKYLFGVKDN